MFEDCDAFREACSVEWFMNPSSWVDNVVNGKVQHPPPGFTLNSKLKCLWYCQAMGILLVNHLHVQCARANSRGNLRMAVMLTTMCITGQKRDVMVVTGVLNVTSVGWQWEAGRIWNTFEIGSVHAFARVAQC